MILRRFNLFIEKYYNEFIGKFSESLKIFNTNNIHFVNYLIQLLYKIVKYIVFIYRIFKIIT